MASIGRLQLPRLAGKTVPVPGNGGPAEIEGMAAGIQHHLDGIGVEQLSLIEDGHRQSGHGRRRGGQGIRNLARITSYNVCYTKLLRHGQSVVIDLLHLALQLVVLGVAGQLLSQSLERNNFV